MPVNSRIIAVVVLGYVGLSAAIAIGRVRRTIGFDIDSRRIRELKQGYDRTNEVRPDEFTNANILFTDQYDELAKANFYIVAVPTPIDDANQPNLTPLLKASQTLGNTLKAGDIVVYEAVVGFF